MINKKAIFVISAGRTGTDFFANFYDHVLKSCVSKHEPDVIRLKMDPFIKTTPFLLKNFNIFKLVSGKVTGKGSMRKISNDYVTGKITREEAKELFIKNRKDFIESFPEDVYVETNNQLYGLVDIIPEVFEDVKIICVVRDGRDWVSSRMNFNTWFSYRDVMNTIGKRLTAKHFKDDKYNKEWDNFNQFQKLCWSWSKINNTILDQSMKNKNVIFVRFEDIFKSDNKEAFLKYIINFTTHAKDRSENYLNFDALLKTKYNKNKEYKFPKYKDWDEYHKVIFEKMCQDDMKIFGYYQDD